MAKKATFEQFVAEYIAKPGFSIRVVELFLIGFFFRKEPVFDEWIEKYGHFE